MLNQSDAQTEDGHAMMKFDTFSIVPELEHKALVHLSEDMGEVHTWTLQQLSTQRRSQGCTQFTAAQARIHHSSHVRVTKDRQEVVGAVGGCGLSGCEKALNDGSGAGLLCYVFT